MKLFSLILLIILGTSPITLIGQMSDTIQLEDVKLIAYYDFTVRKVVEINKDFKRIYFFEDSLVRLFEGQFNKTFYFRKGRRNVSKTVYKKYNNLAVKYLQMFDTSCVIFNVRTLRRNYFYNVDTLIKETHKYKLRSYTLKSSGRGMGTSVPVIDCLLTNKVKEHIRSFSENGFVDIIIHDKRNKKDYKFPNVIIRRY